MQPSEFHKDSSRVLKGILKSVPAVWRVGAEVAKVLPNVVNKLRKYFRLLSPPTPSPEADFVEIDSQRMPVIYRRHSRAKNYVLRLKADRTVVVTLPQRGSIKFAQDFVTSRKTWLEKQWKVLVARNIPPRHLRPGMDVLFRGRNVPLLVEKQSSGWHMRLGNERFLLEELSEDLRPDLELHLFSLAQTELAERVEELAQLHHSEVTRVVVRNQKSRWGSCSYNGTLSLNWRLIQVPPHVRDYIIIHELMHLRELNHSPRFWAEVERACPTYRVSEEWLKENSGRVGF